MATVTAQEAKTVLIPNRFNLFSALGEDWVNGQQLGLGIDPNNHAEYLAISWNRDIELGEKDIHKAVIGLLNPEAVYKHSDLEQTVQSFYTLRQLGKMNFFAGTLEQVSSAIANGVLLEREEQELEPV